ncbi:MAG: ABC transporter permease [Candidatus Sumerlaeia bacterium]|nr:ABC transporter permease [Candidatus Sumerlaeia bacterium]
MLGIAIQMLLGDRIKYLSLVGGVAFATLLMMQQAGIFAGLTYQTGTPIRMAGEEFDLWVMDPEVEFSEESKPIADTVPDRVRGVEGVEWAVPMFKSRMLAKLPDGSQRAISLVGLDDAALVGGPRFMVEGALEDLKSSDAVLLDAAQLGKNFMLTDVDGSSRPLRVGDRFAINDQSVLVAGLFAQERSFFWEPVVYTTYSRALTLAPAQRRMLPYVLVKVRAGEDPLDVASRIEAATGLKALTRDGFKLETARYILLKTGILINFSISVGLGLVIGVLVSAQTFYNFILDNLRHFAALKAIGVGNRALIGMVMGQVLLVGAVGFGIGAGLACALGYVFARVGPGAFLMVWQIPAFVAVSILAVSIGAGALSLRRVLTLEPAIVFRG